MAKKDSTDVFMTELDAYLFGEGTHYEIYNKMGAHKAVKDGQEGVYFAVWAPHAKDIFVVGDFNDWKAYGYDMKPVFIKQTRMPMKPSFARTMHLLLRI